MGKIQTQRGKIIHGTVASSRRTSVSCECADSKERSGKCQSMESHCLFLVFDRSFHLVGLEWFFEKKDLFLCPFPSSRNERIFAWEPISSDDNLFVRCCETLNHDLK